MEKNNKDELENFSQLESQAAQAALAEGFPSLGDQLDRLRNLYLIYRYVVERGTANRAPKGVRILYAKLCNCLIGVHRLLEAGCPGPAAMVTRALFETAVHLQVLLKGDSKMRSRLFED